MQVSATSQIAGNSGERRTDPSERAKPVAPLPAHRFLFHRTHVQYRRQATAAGHHGQQ